MLACLFSYLDRQVLTLLVPPIKAALQISDTQVGLLQGFAFALFFSFVALPCGWLADRYSRRNLLVFGITLWSTATMACGAAHTFTELALARALVGCGEATLMPAAYSMLADSFPPEQRGRVFGAFMAMVYAGGGVALILGGAVLHTLRGEALVSIPLFGWLPVWKAAFVIVGAPGLLVALLATTVREPERHILPTTDSSPDVAWSTYAKRHAVAFVCVWLAYACSGYVAYGVIPWAPTLMVRQFGLSLQQAGVGVGVASVIAGLSGAAIAGVLGDRWTARGVRGGKFRLTLIWWFAVLPLIAAFAFVRNAHLALLAYAGFSLVNAIGYVSSSAVIQDMVPSNLRGRTTAIWYLITGLVGIGFGPLATGLVTDRVFHDEAQLPMAMLAMAAPGVLLGLLASLRGLRAYDGARADAARQVPTGAEASSRQRVMVNSRA
jgi:MFS family permease